MSTLRERATRVRPARQALPADADRVRLGVALGAALVLADEILYWPACGHAIEDDEVLYNSAVCIICERG